MIKYESDKWKIFLKSERHDISEYDENLDKRCV